MQPVHFEIVDEKHDRFRGAYSKQTSLSRLITNAEYISQLFSDRKELRQLRFDELDMLRDIREMTESDPSKFDDIKDPSQYRRQIRSQILPKYLTPNFIRLTREKILAELIQSSPQKRDQDALMTAMVFLQSHTDLGVPCEDNPLWEIIFNLSIKDGIRFVDSLAALIEGLDTLKNKDPDRLSQDPMVLQMTKQVCQWPIFWRQLIEYQDAQPFDSLLSALLRGEMMIELYFDEIIHLPLFLYRQFNKILTKEILLSDLEKEEIARITFNNILKSATIDLPSIIPILKKRLNKAKKKTQKERNNDKVEQIDILINSLNTNDHIANNVFLLTLLIAKISMKKYWENKRDFFFFFTIFKNPEEPRNYFDYGQIMYKQKYFEPIENVYRCAIEVAEPSFWGYWGLGNFQLKRNELFDSERNLLTALKIVQQQEINTYGNLKRELFLIKDDIRKLKLKKLKEQANHQPQIVLF